MKRILQRMMASIQTEFCRAGLGSQGDRRRRPSACSAGICHAETSLERRQLLAAAGWNEFAVNSGAEDSKITSIAVDTGGSVQTRLINNDHSLLIDGDQKLPRVVNPGFTALDEFGKMMSPFVYQSGEKRIRDLRLDLPEAATGFQILVGSPNERIDAFSVPTADGTGFINHTPVCYFKSGSAADCKASDNNSARYATIESTTHSFNRVDLMIQNGIANQNGGPQFFDRGAFFIPGATATATSDPLQVSESGTTDTILVQLDASLTRPNIETAEGNWRVVFDVTSADPDEVKVVTERVTLTEANWDIGELVTIMGNPDGESDGNQVVEISFTVNKELSSGLFHAFDTSEMTQTVSVVDIDPPAATIPSVSIATNSYTEGQNGGGAVPIFSSAAVNDAGGDGEWNGGRLVIGLTANAEAADEISLADSVSGSIRTDGMALLSGTTVIGTLSTAEGLVTGSTPLTIMFNDQATNELVQQTLGAVSFRNTSENPSEEIRAISVTAIDRHEDTGSAESGITVVGVNDPASVSVVQIIDLIENVDTSQPIRVATVEVHDVDGGENELSLGGEHDEFFTLIGRDVFLDAGTELDADTIPEFLLTVSVDDEGVPGGPEDQKDFVVNVFPVVEPQIIDNCDDGFSETGHWSKVQGYGYDNDAQAATESNGVDTATWTFTDLNPGQYELSVTWLGGGDRDRAVPYQVIDGATGDVIGVVEVDQKPQPSGVKYGGRPFQILGEFTITGDTLILTASTEGTSRAVIADAARIESITPPPNQPEITVSSGTISVVDDASFHFGAAQQNDPQLTKTFVVENTGTADLVLNPATVAGLGFDLISDNFSTGQVLAPGESASLTVALDTASLGTWAGNISIANNDPDEDPFNFIITGTIRERQPTGVQIIDDGDEGFSSTGQWATVNGHGYEDDLMAAASVGGADTASWTFSDLTPGQYQVAVTWLRAGDRAASVPYTVRDGATGTVIGSVEVDQTKKPSGTVYDGSPFEILGEFTVTGDSLILSVTTEGTSGAVIADAARIQSVTPVPNSPEIDVSSGTVSIMDGGSFDFGSAEQNDPLLTKTFTVENSGTADLVLSPVTISGSGYQLVSENFAEGQVLAPGETTQLTVGLDTAAIGTFAGTISFANTDPNENPFNFALAGVIQERLPEGVQIVDNGDEEFTATGQWANVPGYGYGEDLLVANGSNGVDTAAWTFNDLTPGRYEVSVSWLRAGDRATNILYELLNGNTDEIIGSAILDQSQAPSGGTFGGANFGSLGIFDVTGDSFILRVTTEGSNLAVIADAARIELVSG